MASKREEEKYWGPYIFHSMKKKPLFWLFYPELGIHLGFGVPLTLSPWSCNSTTGAGLGAEPEEEKQIKKQNLRICSDSDSLLTAVCSAGWAYLLEFLLPTFHLFTGETQNRKETRNSKKFNPTLLTVVLAC